MILDVFFGPGNELHLQSGAPGYTLPAAHSIWQPFIDASLHNPVAVVLPRMVPGGAVKWYVLCGTGQTARVVRDELRAFVGRSYSTFDGRTAELRDEDNIECALKAAYPGGVYLLEASDPTLEDALREKLHLLLRLWRDRPVRLAPMSRATGRVLRDFEYAIAMVDGDAAAACISELRTSGRLGAFNALFLEVRRLGTLGLWRDILAMPEIGSLLATPRPRRVTQTLIQAVYETQLRHFESEGGPAEAIAFCRAEVLPRYGDLYKTQTGLAGYVTDVSFLLAAVASNPPLVERVTDIVARYEGLEHADYMAAIGDRLETTESLRFGGPLEEARNALARADFDRAFAVARALRGSFEKVAILLQCARESGALEAAQIALSATEELSEVEWEQFSKHSALVRIYDGLAVLAPLPNVSSLLSGDEPQAIPSSWEDWLGRLVQPSPWQAAVAVAEAGSREWCFEDLLTSPESVLRLADGLLATRPAWGDNALHDSLPYMITFLLAKGPDVRLRPVYENLLLVAVADAQASLPQLAALCELAEIHISIGMSVADYRNSIATLGRVLEDAGSAQVANPALDLLDTLMTLPCADEVARQSLVVRVHGIFARWHKRITKEQWVLLRELAGEVGIVIEAPEVRQDTHANPTRDRWSIFAGKRVAIYSLREPALRRAQAVLKHLCPSVAVQVFSDHVGGAPSLKAAATSADVFVIAIAAAKHAATDFIEACRPASKATLRARSQGSASLLESLAGFADHPPVE